MTDPLPSTVDHFVALQDGRSRLLATIEGLDEAAAGRIVHGEWRVCDLLAHIASWDELVAEVLRAVAAGEREFPVTAAPDSQWAAWNDQQVRAAAEQTLAARVERLQSARAALLSAAYALDEKLLDEWISPPWGVEDTPRGCLIVQATHDARHADEIAEALHPGSE